MSTDRNTGASDAPQKAAADRVGGRPAETSRVLGPLRKVVNLPRGRGRAGDREFRLATLNLLEDIEAAKRKSDQEARNRQRAEAEVRASEQRYRALFSLMDQGFGIAQIELEDDTPVDFRWLDVNPQFESVTGLSRVAVLRGRRMGELVQGLEPEWLDLFASVAQTGEAMRLERRFESLDRWLEVSAFPVGDPARRQVAVLVTDTTQRQTRVTNLALLAAVADDCSRLSSVAAILRVVCERVARHFGVDGCELVERAGPAEDGDAAADFWRRQGVIEQLRDRATIVVDDVAQIPVAAGSPSTIGAYVVVPLEHSGHRVLGFAVIAGRPRGWRPDEVELIEAVARQVHPALQRAAAQDALRASEERLRLIVDNARDYAILTCDLERRITGWNPGAERLTGYPADEMMGSTADVIFTPEGRAAGAPEREAQTAITEGRATDERWHMRRDGSRFWGSGSMMAMRGAGGEAVGLLKIFRDTTAELRAKEVLERSRRELWEALQETERARKDAEAAGRAKDHLFAVLSHELRTPLTPVMFGTEMLLLRDDIQSDIREALVMIQRNVAMEARLVDDLLDVTRIRHGKVELMFSAMDVHDAVREALEVAKPDIDARKQQLTVALDAGEHRVMGDATRLKQVVWNVLKNASKFTNERGHIRVASRNAPGKVIIEVSDSGIGIDPAMLSKIFETFSQVDASITRTYGGLGLGLAIAKAIVERHGGEIEASSRGLGHGATFTISLPLAGADQ
jgi:PAS domain S-box-containing protein